MRHEDAVTLGKWSELLHLPCDARSAAKLALGTAKLAPSDVRMVPTCAELALGTAHRPPSDVKLARPA